MITNSPPSLLTYRQWLESTPVARRDADLEHRPTNLSELAAELEGNMVPVIFEGPRYVGKTYTVARLSEMLKRPAITAGRAIKTRKDVMGTNRPDRATHKTGSADYEDFNLSVAQAHLWLLDSWHQSGDFSPLVDRTLISSIWFQHAVYQSHWDLWVRLMVDTGAILVSLEPVSNNEHLRRCNERQQDWYDLRIEKLGYADMIRRVPESVIVWPVSIIPEVA